MLTGAVDGYQVVLLIHGIRTEADWGPMVRSKIEVPGQIEVIPIRYGYFDAIRFWFPFWTRNKPIERVYKEIRVALQKYRRSHPDAKLSIIAHSFGTYIVGEILKRGFDLQFHRLILCGSVLPQDFPWEQYQGRFDDDKVVNECGKSDIWPVLAQSASWGYGASGTHGFGAVLVKDRFHAGGHGQYFKPEFVEKYWEPFIRRGEYKGTEYEVKMPPTPWWISLLGILPLKWVILTVLILSMCFSFNTLLRNAFTAGPSVVSGAKENKTPDNGRTTPLDSSSGDKSQSSKRDSGNHIASNSTQPISTHLTIYLAPQQIYLDDAATDGPSDAPVTMVLFSDLQDPFSARLANTLMVIRKSYMGKIRFAFRNFPLSMHLGSEAAAIATLAAQRQGKYLEYVDAAFHSASEHHLDDAALESIANKLDLNIQKFKKDIKDPALKERVEGDIAYAKELGVPGTPTVFINGKLIIGSRSVDDYKAYIEAILRVYK